MHYVENCPDEAPSFKRFIRQAVFIPALHSRWVTPSLLNRLTQAVTQAEVGHRGEIVCVIENQLPLFDAYHAGCLTRAIELFSTYRVWDTEENTGVLVYVNVCEHDLEIVADRGIHSHVGSQVWGDLCQQTLNTLSKGNMEAGLTELVTEIGNHLRAHYALADNPQGNELCNHVIYIK